MTNIVPFSSTGFPGDHCTCSSPGGPGCTCCPPSGWDGAQWGDPPWGKQLRHCWNEIAQLKQIIRSIMTQMGPFPLTGVTDGSDAKPGEVGEYISGAAQVPYAAYPAFTETVVSVLVVPPGDWDLYMASEFNSLIGGTAIYVDPPPAGLSSALEGTQQVFQTTAGATEINTTLIGRFARGSFSVPTLLPVRVKVDQSTDAVLTAGTCLVNIQGRRAR